MPTALITGASSGLGEVFAIELGREKFDLILTARREDRLEQVAAKARQQGAATVTVMPADLSRRDAPGEFHSQVAAQGLRVDWLINNAGFGTRGHFQELDPARELQAIDLNVISLVALTRLFLPAMVAAKAGTVINVASTAAFQPVPFMSTYGATKAFVLSFSEALYGELAGSGVHVMALCPGPTHTEFQQVAGAGNARLPSFAYMDAQTVVRQGLAAARKRRPLCINGALNLMMVEANRFAPRTLIGRIAAAMFRPSK